MRILIADDSAIVRTILSQNLEKIPGFQVVCAVSTGRKALDFARSSKVDVALLDFDMPEMNGIEAASIFVCQLKIPSIVLSENTRDSSCAFDVGAVFLRKPNVKDFDSAFFRKLSEKLKSSCPSNPVSSLKNKASSSKNSVPRKNSEPSFNSFKVLCIGASTGGPTAVSYLLSHLGESFPVPILYTQHIEVGADKTMVRWLDETCPNLNVKIACDGEEAVPGCVYMAPADRHLLVARVKPNGNPVLKISDDPPERFLRPAVNRMFSSAAEHYKKACLAVLLTGMGRDGADGCKKIVDGGGFTIAEDKSTCTVFGMPAAAIEVGGAKEILPRGDIPARIRELVHE
ncbi:MAG: response regulator [Treponema sp.]|nr:response regulator [Treponema sp.]MBR4630169.1 response regulator [Treponema sp.]